MMMLGAEREKICHQPDGLNARRSWVVYLRFMSPLKAREKMLDKVPPGQQPQMSTVTALTGSICRSLARLKAVRGMMPNWASSAMATPFGFTRWTFILESSMVQPREIIVMKRMVTVKISMVLFRVGGISRTNVLPLLEKFPSPEMWNVSEASVVFSMVFTRTKTRAKGGDRQHLIMVTLSHTLIYDLFILRDQFIIICQNSVLSNFIIGHFFLNRPQIKKGNKSMNCCG